MTNQIEQHLAGMTPHQQILFTGEYHRRTKSKLIAYLLAIPFGGLGAHRFYLGQPGYAFSLIAFYHLFWLGGVWMAGSSTYLLLTAAAGLSNGLGVLSALSPLSSLTVTASVGDIWQFILEEIWLTFVALFPAIWIWQLSVLWRDVNRYNKRVAKARHYGAVRNRSFTRPGATLDRSLAFIELGDKHEKSNRATHRNRRPGTR
jgi:TM2 domain-containing membrane protein YozV